MSEDPFDEVKADVAASLNSVEAGLQRWRGQRDASTSKRLLSELETIDEDLSDMEAAIAAAAADPERFQISEATLAARRAFVRSTSSSVAAARQELARGRGGGAGASGSKRVAGEERVGLLSGSGGGGAETPGRGGGGGGSSRRQAGMDHDNAQIASAHAELQQAFRRHRRWPSALAAPVQPPHPTLCAARAGAARRARRDARAPTCASLLLAPWPRALDVRWTCPHRQLGEAVGRLKQLGGAMGQELASQNAMLSDLEAGLDETASGMDALKGKMRALLPKHEPKQKMAICFLSVLLIILVILVLS